MTDIPDDVMKAARDAVDAMPERPPFKMDVEVAIARAIMAERELCVQIVEGYPPDDTFVLLYDRTTVDDESDPFWKYSGDLGS